MKIEDNPMLEIDVKCWQQMAILSSPGKSWRLYVIIVPLAIFNIMQFLHFLDILGDFLAITFNLYFWVTTLISFSRALMVHVNRHKFESLMEELSVMYSDIEESAEVFLKGILKKPTRTVRNISIFNLTAGALNVMYFVTFPLLLSDRVHPLGVALPGVNLAATPYYEIVYAMECLILPFGVFLTYIPFVSLFVAFTIFGRVTLQVLQLRLTHICDDEVTSEKQRYQALKNCINYYTRIYNYVTAFNDLVTYFLLVEFLLYCVIVCCLLFCMNFATSVIDMMSSVALIGTVLYILFIYYWFANELLIESLNVQDIAFGIQWYNCNQRFKRDLLQFITLTGKPLNIMLGNLYPMSLRMFQSLLNTSYSVFTVLRRLYAK